MANSQTHQSDHPKFTMVAKGESSPET